MYKLSQNKQEALLFSADHQAKASICLNEGGRLKELTLENELIIQDPVGMGYEQSFAAAILFPFANRIAQGKYSFNNRDYQLPTNEEGRNNAIHGLVYDKTFQVVDHHENKGFASISLVYKEKHPPAGFPFPFVIRLTYKLFADKLELKVNIYNTGQQDIPFTLGWHPYFYSSELSSSKLNFHPQYQVLFDKNMITKGKESAEIEKPFLIADKNLDDCFILQDQKVEFLSFNNQIGIQSEPFHPYLQIYTPPTRDAIAIEPITGISDSFNNKIGLQVLKADESFEQIWQVTKP